MSPGSTPGGFWGGRQERRQCHSALDAKLLVDPSQVILDRSEGEAETLRDVAIGKPARGHVGDLPFTAREQRHLDVRIAQAALNGYGRRLALGRPAASECCGPQSGAFA